MLIEMPYFMENEEWYYHDPVEFKYKLTEKAPKKAVKSYKEFYRTMESLKGAELKI